MTITEPMVEVLTGPERRRRWSVDQKLAIVAESLRPGASPLAVARRHGISSGHLYTWRRLIREGALSPASPEAGLLPVHVTAEPAVAGPTPPALPAPSGRMAIVLPNGWRVEMDGTVDETALSRVLSALGRGA